MLMNLRQSPRVRILPREEGDEPISQAFHVVGLTFAEVILMRLAIIAIVLVVLPVSALFSGEQLGISGLGSTSNATEVRVEVAEEGDLVESVSPPAGSSQCQVALSAEVCQVIEVLIDEGDAVTKGVLVRLEDRSCKPT